MIVLLFSLSTCTTRMVELRDQLHRKNGEFEINILQNCYMGFGYKVGYSVATLFQSMFPYKCPHALLPQVSDPASIFVKRLDGDEPSYSYGTVILTRLLEKGSAHHSLLL